ncbi:MAG: metal-dependent transcriptional regulator [Methanofollis sp.]|uniref:metal-dependent transcriptional regulator n=1 Tax=Methanofollis sp. TaxID=2052835 RepID=UPI0026153AB8|nr:metal-dependent transcriptional regulator [Methanofollis sp.]MDD4253962.1 metal-dependent transcriptional regulator [Methanofollis sp.]
MSSSVREDCLEAILTLSGKGCRPVSEAGIGGAVDADTAEVVAALRTLVADEDIVLQDGGYLLTPQGKTAAEIVFRKHRVLECFLSEMLGMDTGAASKEACVLEHGVSDETIDRLSTYIQDPGRHRAMRRGAGAGRHSRHTLLDFAEGDTVEVTMIRCIGKNRRLIDLGVIPGEKIVLQRKLGNNAVVVTVKGADIALSPEIASTIFAEKTA